jgi:SAM-dependent methyltransferase
MQITSGLRSLLSAATIYDLAMRLLRNGNNEWFAREVLALGEGEKIIDIGCGTARILELLPSTVRYVGLDVSPEYVAAARARYGHRASFHSGSIENWRSESELRDADLVLCNGVLHHIDDEGVASILRFAESSLRFGGRFIFYETCFLRWQSAISRYWMSLDRGQATRTEAAWRALVSPVFPGLKTEIVTGVNRLGYTCIIGEAVKTANPSSLS